TFSRVRADQNDSSRVVGLRAQEGVEQPDESGEVGIQETDGLVSVELADPLQIVDASRVDHVVERIVLIIEPASERGQLAHVKLVPPRRVPLDLGIRDLEGAVDLL